MTGCAAIVQIHRDRRSSGKEFVVTGRFEGVGGEQRRAVAGETLEVGIVVMMRALTSVENSKIISLLRANVWFRINPRSVR